MNAPSMSGKEDITSNNQIGDSKIDKPEFIKESRADSIQGIISSKVTLHP
jgi:hypothetical protein